MYAATLGSAAFAASLALWLTARGLILSSDSVQYLAAGERLAADGALLGLAGDPFTAWPPLLPLLIAALTGLGLPVPGTIRLLNTLAYAASAAVVGRYLLSTTGRTPIVACGVLLLILHPWVGYVHGHVWSEPLFLLWSLLALTESHSAGRLTLFTALACLTRYAGVSLVPAGVLALLSDPRWPRAVRVRRAGIFAVGSLTPLMVWVWRNWYLSGTPFGGRAESTNTLTSAAASFAGQAIVSVAPHRIASALPDLWWVGALAAGWGLTVYLVRRNLHTPAALALVWGGLYSALLVVSAAHAPMDPFGARLFVPFVGAAAVALPLLRPAAVAVCVALWIGAMGNYRDAALWRTVRDESPATLRARARDPLVPVEAVHIVSNWPEAAYLAHGRRVAVSPRRTPYRSPEVIAEAELAELRRKAVSGRTVLLWYDRDGASQLLPLSELTGTVSLERLTEAPGVTVYLVRP